MQVCPAQVLIIFYGFQSAASPLLFSCLSNPLQPNGCLLAGHKNSGRWRGEGKKEERRKKLFCILGCASIFTFYGGGNSLTHKGCPLAVLPQDQAKLGGMGYREGIPLAEQTDVGCVRSLCLWEEATRKAQTER